MNEIGVMGMMGVLALSAVFFVWLLGIAAFLFWLWVLVDILRSEFTGSNKIVWLVAVILLPLLGAALYWFIGREQKTGESRRPLQSLNDEPGRSDRNRDEGDKHG